MVYCSKSSKAGNGSNGAGNSTDIGGKIDYGKDVNKKKNKAKFKIKRFSQSDSTMNCGIL